ncbi:MAG TPA: glutaredoxin family protein [Nitrososphaerales archaeon]|nr:glutaredoxin family protein [Nitrososphaerales archaeon]
MHEVNLKIERADQLHKITVISKDGCHLCERVVDKLKELSTGGGFKLEIVEITKDRSTYEKYFLRIPVVQLDDKDVFEVEDIALPTDCKLKLETLVSHLD